MVGNAAGEYCQLFCDGNLRMIFIAAGLFLSDAKEDYFFAYTFY